VRGQRPGRQVNLLEEEIKQLCLQARQIFLSQAPLLELDAPIKICGDIHGQYHDLLRLFEYGGFPPTSNCTFLVIDNARMPRVACLVGGGVRRVAAAARVVVDVQVCSRSVRRPPYGETQLTDSVIALCLALGAGSSCLVLFLGDYVDRGKQSIETICLLMAFKVRYPENFFVLRGNHECSSINRIYGFYDECRRRYNIKLWKTFCDVFNCMPVAAIVDEKIFCTHGGLSPELTSMEQIRRIQRPTDVPDQGLLCDLLWSDPDGEIKGWGENDRGVSFTFGGDIVARFLQRFDLDLVCRAHQVVEDGYSFFCDRRLVTIFSAPNYCGEFDNAGAMMSVDETLMCSFQILKPADKKKMGGFGNQ